MNIDLFASESAVVSGGPLSLSAERRKWITNLQNHFSDFIVLEKRLISLEKDLAIFGASDENLTSSQICEAQIHCIEMMDYYSVKIEESGLKLEEWMWKIK